MDICVQVGFFTLVLLKLPKLTLFNEFKMPYNYIYNWETIPEVSLIPRFV